MNTAMISALAALAGSAIGASAPILSSYILQRNTALLELTNQQIAQREDLYSDFIQQASRLFISEAPGAVHNLDQLLALYALVSRIRLFASRPVVKAAEDFVKEFAQHVGEPLLNAKDVRAAVLAKKVDPLNEFSSACRKELRTMLHRPPE